MLMLGVCCTSPVSALGPAFYSDGTGTYIEGVDSENPVIYDNEYIEDVIDCQYIMSKASLGEVDLVGIVGTCYIDGGWIDSLWDFFPLLWNQANNSGLCMDRIPYPVQGQRSKMNRPGDGVIEHTSFNVSDGSTLIVNEANKCTPEKPLLIYIGAQAGSAAVAYLQDNSIADKVMVFHTDGVGYNGKDSWAREICIERFRYVHIGKSFWFNQTAKPSYCDWWVLPTPSWCAVDEWGMFPDNEYCNYIVDTFTRNFHYNGQLPQGHWDGPLDGFWVGVYAPGWWRDGMVKLKKDWGPASNDTEYKVLDMLLPGYDAQRAAHDELLQTWINPDAYDGICPNECRPKNLAATPVSTTQVDLTWEFTDRPDLDCVATGFTVERKLASGGDFAPVGTAGAAARSYSDSGLTASTSYLYRVMASLQIGGTSEYSNQQTVTTLDEQPAAPSNLVATPSASSLEVTLTWQDNSDNEQGFAIWRKEAGGTYAEVGTAPANATSKVDSSGLSSSTLYYYQVTAYNSGGAQHSDPSNEAFARTACVLDPQIVDDADPAITYVGTWSAQNGWGGRYLTTIHESDASGAYAEFTFNGSEVKLFADKQGHGGTGKLYIDGVYQMDANFNGATAYQVEIASIGNLPCGEHTLRIEVDSGWNYVDFIQYTPCCPSTVTNPPADPTGLSVVADGSSGADLSWQDNAGDNEDEEDLYVIERKADGESVFTEVAQVSGMPGIGNTVNYADSGLTYSTTYTYRVYGLNTIGNSGYTSEVPVTTGPPDPPPSPVNLACDAGDARIDLSWDAVTADPEVLYYIVHRSTSAAGPYNAVAVAFGSNSIVDFSVLNDTTYYYRVVAVSTWGMQSGQSLEADGTPSEPTAPDAPSDLAAGAGTDYIALSWTDNSDNEDEFQIERMGPGETVYSLLATVNANTTSYSDNGLDSGEEYCYQVRASNEVGPSAYAGPVCETTSSCVPELITVDDADPLITYTGSWSPQSGWTGRYMDTLHETESNGAAAEISFSGTSVELLGDLQPWGGNATVYIDGVSQGTVSFNGSSAYQQVIYSSGTLSNESHTFRVVCNGGGWTYVDAIEFMGCVAPPAPPAAPSNLTATANGTSITLAWQDNSGNEQGFKIERDGVEIALVSADVTGYVNSGLNPLTSYTYRVRAYNAGGHSAYSNEATETTGEQSSAVLPNYVALTPGAVAPYVTTNEQVGPDGYNITSTGWIGGHGIWYDGGAGDMSPFHYVELTGDFTLSVQVTTMMNSVSQFGDRAHQCAIIMAREMLDPKARMFAGGVTGEQGFSDMQYKMFWRNLYGGNIGNGGAEIINTNTGDNPATRYAAGQVWMRMQRVDDEFSIWSSYDGVNWQFEMSRDQERWLAPPTMYVGLCVHSLTTGSYSAETVQVEYRNLTVSQP